MNKEKYLFVIHGLPIGGAEKFLISLLSYFTKRKIHCDLILLSNDLTLLNQIPSNVSVTIIEKSRKIDFIHLFKLKDKIQFFSPDLIICINAYSYFLTKLSLLFSPYLKICLSHHSTIPFSLKNYLQTKLYFFFACSDDMIVFLCKSQSIYLKKKYSVKMGVTHIVYNGIDFEKYNQSLFNSRINYSNIDFKKRYVILMVARISPEKNHKDAILAIYELIIIHNCSVELQLVGSGDKIYQLTLQKLVDKLGISEFVIFKGSTSDTREFYLSADMFLLTSSSETFPISVIEAMSFGLPSVITDVGGAKELIVEGLNGYTVPVGNIKKITETCLRCIQQQWNVSRIREYAFNNFNQNNMFSSYEQIFHDYVSK